MPMCVNGGSAPRTHIHVLLGMFILRKLPPAELTASWPDPAIYLDPAYWAELHHRNALWPVPARVDLNTYRQQQPPGYPLGQQRFLQAC